MDDFDVDDAVQRALDRLSLLAEVTTASSSTMDPYEGLHRACRMLVPQLCDWCTVDLLEEGRVSRACVVTRDPETLSVDRRDAHRPPVPESGTGPLARVLRGSDALFLDAGVIPSSDRATDELQARQLELFEQLGARTVAVAPLRVRRQVLGALTLVRTTDQAPLTEDDLPLAEDLGHRIALAVDNARLYRETQRIAEHLQRSLLPALSHTGPLMLAGRYVPATTSAEVGGDWYDSFRLHAGQTMIVGDVTGHDLRAAIVMSQLRNMLRGIGCDRQEPPAEILHRLDIAHHMLYPDATATCAYALLSEGEGGSWRLDYSSAGHLPPLLVTEDGDSRYLDEGCGLMLGVEPDTHRTNATEPLPGRSTLLLFTDGLIERRSEDLEVGFGRLRRHTAALAREPLDAFCDRLLARMAEDHTDDVALLAARVPGPHQ